MSSPVTISTGLPIVSQALEPEWVRDGSPATQKAYESALAFEDALVEQLSQSLTASSGLTGEVFQDGQEEGEPSAAAAGNSELSSLLPGTLTQSVMSAGGLGLAAQMTHELEGVHTDTNVRADGGTDASAIGTAKQTDHGKTGGSAASAGGQAL